MPCFQVTLQGHHFVIPVQGGPAAHGFLVFRRVTAGDVIEAKKKAEDILLSETRVRDFIRFTEKASADPRWFIRAEKASELTWLGRLFMRTPEGFIFYESEA